MLSRLALRLAAIEGLCPAAMIVTGPWPTIAGSRVYDSRLDPIEDDDSLKAIEGQPILIVYTETQDSTPYGDTKFPADEQIVYLVVEVLIAAAGSVAVTLADGTTETVGTIEPPIADRQHEALLDLLEAQVRRVLDIRTLAPSATLVPLVAMELRKITSVPQRDGSRATRYAARTVTFEFKVKQDRWAPFAVTPPLSGFALLPYPLSQVAMALPPGSSGASLCQSLVPMVPQPAPTSPAFTVQIFTGLNGRLPTQSNGSDADVQSTVTSTTTP